jgi:hypothetical protein
LNTAASECHEEVVRVLLGDARADPNLADRDGNTPLLIAADEGHASVVKLLTSSDRVDPNMTAQSGNTPLMIAAHNGYAAIVQLLLRSDLCDPNVESPEGRTAVDYAAFQGRMSNLVLLLSDHRTKRSRPTEDSGGSFSLADRGASRRTYDQALRAVILPRRARFRGLVRAMVAFRRLRLRAAQAVYAPGGAGFEAASANFQAAAAARTTTTTTTPMPRRRRAAGRADRQTEARRARKLKRTKSHRKS